MNEKYWSDPTYIIQHVQDAPVSGFVHSLVGGDEHSQRSWTAQREGRPTVLQTVTNTSSSFPGPFVNSPDNQNGSFRLTY